MSEKPLERLNYHNGQRLEASDLKLEQEYHIRVRRWLNKSLYEPGIAAGLVVRQHPTETLAVVVGRGLALDGDGREIILLEETELDVPRRGRVNAKGEHEGIYLVIQYAEQVTALESDGCTPRRNGKPASRLAWGGTARVLAEPRLSWSDVLPYVSSGQIVLARVILNKGCTEVEIVDPGVRRYVGAAAAAKVRQYALEGEREIDPNNPGKIYFHVRGRQPNAVTLYLRAEKFSTLHYSEMGWHSHGVSGQLTVPEHKHDIPAWHTEAPVDDIAPIISEIRAHADTSIWAGVGLLIAGAAKVANPLLIPTPTAIDAVVAGLIASNAASPNEELALTLSPLMLPAVSVTVGDISLEVMPQTNFRNLEDEVLGPRVAMKIIMDEDKQKKLRAHKHDIMAWETEDVDAKTFNLGNIAKTAPTGANGPANPATPTEEEKLYQARPSGAPLTYIRGLQVWIDGDNKTDDILSQLQNAQPTENWTELGDGAGNHVLTMKGTGEIKLDFLPGVTFDEGEHCIELRAPAIPNKSNGGRILYNLYVE